MEMAVSSEFKNPNAFNLNGGSESFGSVDLQASRLNVAASTSKDITITTREGDTVTLSYDQMMQADYATYSYGAVAGRMGRDGDQGAYSIERRQFEASRFSYQSMEAWQVKVEGNLNDEELADIRNAVTQIDKIMSSSIENGDSAAMNTPVLADLESLSGLSASYSQEIRITAQSLRVQETKYDRDGLHSGSKLGQRRQGRRERINQLADQMMGVIDNKNIDYPKFVHPLKKMFHEMKGQFEKTMSDPDPQNQWINDVSSALLERLGSR
jgi:hypothetical protein